MIHSIHTMKIGRFGLLDATNNSKLLRKSYNLFPVNWFDNRVKKFFDEVTKIFNAGDQNNYIYDNVERIYMLNKILHLTTLYDGLYNSIIQRGRLKAAMDDLGRNVSAKDSSAYFIDDLQKYFNISLYGPKDIEKVKQEIVRLTDKYNERYPEHQKDTTKDYSFYRTALGIFAIMEQPYNSQMTLAEFGKLKELADDRIRQYEKMKHKHGTA